LTMFLLTSVVDCVPNPLFAGLDPLLRIQLEQAILSDCPSQLVSRLDPNCKDQEEECLDKKGEKVDPQLCRTKCEPEEEYCPKHPLCNFNMDQCIRTHCAPVKVTQCPIHSGSEVKTICTPTISLSCSQEHHKKCGSGLNFNECLLKAGSCTEHVSNHCVTVPVFKGKGGACTVEIQRNCTQKDMDLCHEQVGQDCRDKCEKPSIKCQKSDKCPAADVSCKMVPAQSCHRMVKEKVCGDASSPLGKSIAQFDK